jgi:hypothetical protein
MTYSTLQSIITGLLTGDNVLPQVDTVLTGLVDYALTTVATKADSLHLMTLDSNADVLRLGPGDYLIRRPASPLTTIDTLDIDEELSFAVARMVASMLSREKGGIHMAAANRIILDYNAKVHEILEQMQMEAVDESIAYTNSIAYGDSTEFSL